MLLENWRMTKEFLYLDGMWWEQNRGSNLEDQYLDTAAFVAKRAFFITSMNQLLRHAQVDPSIVQSHVENESQIGLSKRAVFGLNIVVDKFDRKPSNGAIKQLRNFVIKKRDIARLDFYGYEYDDQSMYGDAVNFVDYMLAMQFI